MRIQATLTRGRRVDRFFRIPTQRTITTGVVKDIRRSIKRRLEDEPLIDLTEIIQTELIEQFGDLRSTESPSDHRLSPLEQMQAQATPELSMGPTLAEWVQRDVADKRRRGLKESTIRHFEDSMVIWLRKLGSRRLSRIAYEDVAEVYHHEVERAQEAGRSLRTVNRKLAELRRSLERAFNQSRMDRNPARGIDPVLASPAKRRPVLDIAALQPAFVEWDRLDANAGAGNGQAYMGHGMWFRILVLTGVRAGALAALAWSDIDEESHTLCIREKGNRRVGKADSRTIPASKAVFVLLARHKAVLRKRGTVAQRASGLVFPSRNGKRSKPAARARKAWIRGMIAAGLPSGRKNGYVQHDLRSCAVVTMTDAGVPDRVRQEVVGHNDSAVHALYDRVSERNQREALAALEKVFCEQIAEPQDRGRSES